MPFRWIPISVNDKTVLVSPRVDPVYISGFSMVIRWQFSRDLPQLMRRLNWGPYCRLLQLFLGELNTTQFGEHKADIFSLLCNFLF